VCFCSEISGVRGPGLTLIFVPIQQMVRVSLRTVTMPIPSPKITPRQGLYRHRGGRLLSLRPEKP